MPTTNESANGGRKMWKVLAPTKSRTNPDKTYWNKLGIAYTNNDGSIHIFCDSWPSLSNQLQIRDFDEQDRRAGASGGGSGGPLFNPADTAALAATIANAHASPNGAASDVPF